MLLSRHSSLSVLSGNCHWNASELIKQNMGICFLEASVCSQFLRVGVCVSDRVDGDVLFYLNKPFFLNEKFLGCFGGEKDETVGMLQERIGDQVWCFAQGAGLRTINRKRRSWPCRKASTCSQMRTGYTFWISTQTNKNKSSPCWWDVECHSEPFCTAKEWDYNVIYLVLD